MISKSALSALTGLIKLAEDYQINGWHDSKTKLADAVVSALPALRSLEPTEAQCGIQPRQDGENQMTPRAEYSQAISDVVDIVQEMKRSHIGYWADYLLGRLGMMASPLPKAETQEWRLIETAPKTGEHILVAEFNPERIGFGFCGGKRQSMMTVVHWWDNPGEEGWYASIDSQGETPFPATHWKPLKELET